MNSLRSVVPFVAVVATACFVNFADAADIAASASAPDPVAQIAEGRRLVENVALCIDCHASRLPTGEFDRTRWLQGSLLPFEPTVEMPWSNVAPPLAGLPGYTDEAAVRFLMTGERALGPVRPPMPAFRFNESEARAIVAYLRSIAPN